MNGDQLELVEVRPIQKDLLSLDHVEEWTGMAVNDESSEKLCGERMNLLYERREKLKADRDSVVKPLQVAIKRVDAMANPILLPLKAAYDGLNLKLGMYLNDKRRKEEAAKKKAQDEEAARLKAAADKKAADAIASGDERKFEEAVVDERIAAHIQAAPIQAKQKTEVSSGAAFVPVTRWYARIVDPLKIPRDYLLIDETKLNRLATAMKGDAKVPGVEFYSETTTQRRGG